MILTVQAAHAASNRDLMDAMFRLRGQVFGERLGWNVTVLDGRERDAFDDANPLYLCSVDGDGRLQGSLRLLPTTGPNMLRDVFGVLLDDPDEIVESPIIWESTRFCVTQESLARRSRNRLNYTTGELLAGIVEVGQMVGLQSVVSVYDARMRRVLRSAGCPAHEIGSPKKIGGVTTYAGLFEISDVMLERIRSAAGIRESVLREPTRLVA